MEHVELTRMPALRIRPSRHVELDSLDVPMDSADLPASNTPAAHSTSHSPAPTTTVELTKPSAKPHTSATKRTPSDASMEAAREPPLTVPRS